MPRWRWLITQLRRRLWVHATLIGALGILAAMVALFADHYLPWTPPGHISAGALDSILTIMASTMLAVTTFSLSIMVSAYGAVTSSVTPRATKLVTEDRLSQNVLSTFLGSFLFSMVGLVVLKTGAYGARGRVVLFIFTLIVIVLVVIALMRWIDHLTHLGRVGVTTDWVENATRKAIEERLKAPYLGGSPLRGMRQPDNILPVTAAMTGYIGHIDISQLSNICESADSQIFVQVLPGSFVYPGTPLAWLGDPGLTGEEANATLRKAADAFFITDERAFDQDPRFGFAVLSEIACRALSAAVNDYGTAIDVIGRVTRLLPLWSASPRPEEARHPRVFVPPLQDEDIFEDAFQSIARDGAALIEVQLRLQKALIALSSMGNDAFQQAARAQSETAQARADRALTLEADKARLRALWHLG